MKKLISIILTAAMIIVLAGCQNRDKPMDVEIVDDNYRNIYEIFVASYYDSNGDKVGDLNGVTKKLDYIASMGYTGIWLMPIHPSPSYHKYDVTDYYDIDPSYGTLEDFEKLCQEAHKRNINIIIDLVVNHSSSEHPWFLEALSAYRSGRYSPYLDYYNFSDTAKFGYASRNGVYYEARFVDTMPDLNLDSLKVRQEISYIMKFWIEKGADGFRLDAVTSYYTGDEEKNIEFLTWLNKTAKIHKEDCYIVGESWTNDSVIRRYYTSGVDSFFLFSLSQLEGTIVQSIKGKQPVPLYRNALNNAINIAQGHIPAIFLDNHDINRITGSIGRSNVEQVKFAYGLAGMINGTLYDYYGTEIGMVGSRMDENKRIAMLWDSNKMDQLCTNPPGATQTEYAFEGVVQQQKDSNSILNYHKQINYLRNKYPAIPRGKLEILNKLSNDRSLVFEKTWNDQKVCIVICFDKTESIEVDLTSLEGYSVCEFASANGEKVEFKDGILKMPAYSIAVLSTGN